MSNITMYASFIEQMFGTPSGKSSVFYNSTIKSFQVSQLSSGAIQAELKAAGIDTNSKQYKAAVSVIMKAGNGAMYTNIQGIKNLMKQYDKNGDYIDPTTGLTGLLVTEENESSRKRIISIPESSKEEMFELTKKEFLRENGVSNGDTTKRGDVYTNLYRKMKKDDRLAAGWTMQQYERAYRQAFLAAVRETNPNWKIGDSIPSGALDGVARESVEAKVAKSGEGLAAAMDIKI